MNKSLKYIFGTAAIGGAGIAAAMAGGVGSVAFALPFALPALGVLPALWYITRNEPRTPRPVQFPTFLILKHLQSQEPQPMKMPWWHRALYMMAASSMILGASMPHLVPETPLDGNGPIMIVVDNGWASAKNWQKRMSEMSGFIDRAESEGRPVIILPTAPQAGNDSITLGAAMDAAEARRYIKEMKPNPWPSDRQSALKALETLDSDTAPSIVWLGDGINDDGTLELAEKLQEFGKLLLLEDAPQSAPHMLAPPTDAEEALSIKVMRPNAGSEESLTVVANDAKGRPLAQTTAKFAAGETQTMAVFEDLADDLRNQIEKIAIEGENTAGAVLLVDENMRRRPVGMVDPATATDDLPLLSESNYIETALKPYTDFQKGSVDELVERKPAVIILTDDATLSPAQQDKLGKWVEEGGMLLRFAGPRLAAENGQDKLLPVKLRPGVRNFGGSLTANSASQMAPFSEGTPFYGMKTPQNINIKSQVIAQPSLDIDEHTWARLEDGTPLVTADKRGEGQIVLVHVRANADWSNLPLTGFFVDMLRKSVASSQGVKNEFDPNTPGIPPIRMLDGAGAFAKPAPGTLPLTGEDIQAGNVSSSHPPGFYGNESTAFAHNIHSAVPELAPFPKMPENTARMSFAEAHKEKDYTGLLVTLGILSLMGGLGISVARKRKRMAENNNKQGPASSGPGIKPQ